jgi:UDP-N-acetylmuramate dehydrogenase
MIKIKENIDLSKYNTFRTGGNARFFCKIKSEGELFEAIGFSKKKKVRFAVIGNGSNLLIDDKDFNGLIIKNSIKGICIEKKNKNTTIVSSYSGENFDDLISFVKDYGLSGVENLWYIPGTVGASVVQNIGAYGTEVKDFIYNVECFDIKKNKKIFLTKNECKFNYRESIFKKNKNLIIIKVYFKLNNFFHPNLEYKILKEIFNDRKNIKIEYVIKVIEKIRKEKLPDWKKVGTAGSFFKNPVICICKYRELSKEYPDLPMFKEKKGYVKIPLAYVLDKICNLKDFRIGDVGLYVNQPLVLVNYGNATYKEINSFVKKVEKKVFEKIKIKIEREVEEIF